ncbi:uncharacterized protein F4812DRAFT_141291 [Daldinia caldariorum]|uniref:uncharacterized protein n=1 Tax=Daldinia caldariorum TaxID=326644 RepID=UPI0020088687|nr:uncharacterized protein F4812DRAFT_141291 [Daldinia caldariorum]KAI1464830.1 hypothetical protein F4812DRAFT_141291 [Daldinia caldariorum]
MPGSLALRMLINPGESDRIFDKRWIANREARIRCHATDYHDLQDIINLGFFPVLFQLSSIYAGLLNCRPKSPTAFPTFLDFHRLLWLGAYIEAYTSRNRWGGEENAVKCFFWGSRSGRTTTCSIGLVPPPLSLRVVTIAGHLKLKLSRKDPVLPDSIRRDKRVIMPPIKTASTYVSQRRRLISVLDRQVLESLAILIYAQHSPLSSPEKW